MRIQRLGQCHGPKTTCVATTARCRAKTCGTTVDPSHAISRRHAPKVVRRVADHTGTVGLTATVGHEAMTGRMATRPMAIGKAMAITVTTDVAKKLSMCFCGNRVGVTPTRIF